MKKKYKIIAGALILLVALAAVISIVYKEEKITVIEIGEKKNLKETVRETGIVKSGRTISLSSSFDGEVDIFAELGDRVKKGQLIAEIDPENIENAVSQINAQISSITGQKNATGMTNPQSREIEAQKIQIENIKSNLEKAKTDMDISQELFELGGLSESQIKSMENALKNMEAELKIQEKNLGIMQKNSSAMNTYFNGQIQSLQSQKNALLSKKSKAQIFSPFDGIITSLNFSDGDFVSPQRAVAEISSSDDKTVISEIGADVAAELKEGDKVDIIYETKNTTKEFKGKIVKISDFALTRTSSLGLEEQKMIIETSFEGEAYIPVGYSLDIKFTTIDKPGTLSIPKMSIFEKDGEDHILKVENGKIKTQKIKSGIETATMTEILEGIDTGDIVVAEPDNEKLKEGTRVTY